MRVRILLLVSILLYLSIVLAYVPALKTSANLTLTSGYTPSFKDNANLSLLIGGVTDSCTVPGSGNYVINCADSCTFNSDSTIAGNVSMTGAGTIILNANWTLTKPNTLFVQNNCELFLSSGNRISWS